MLDPKTLKYADSHEWVALDGNVATIGISKFAVDQLTDLILIDLGRAGVGTNLEAGRSFGEIESVKAVADLYAPVSGEVIEVNEALTKDAQLLSQDPYNKGWLLKVRINDPSAAVAHLMDHETYERKVSESAH